MMYYRRALMLQSYLEKRYLGGGYIVFDVCYFSNQHVSCLSLSLLLYQVLKMAILQQNILTLKAMSYLLMHGPKQI